MINFVGNFFMVGCALAMTVSYVKWNSIWWAILHGIFNWLYVLYFGITYS